MVCIDDFQETFMMDFHRASEGRAATGTSPMITHLREVHGIVFDGHSKASVSSKSGSCSGRDHDNFQQTGMPDVNESGDYDHRCIPLKASKGQMRTAVNECFLALGLSLSQIDHPKFKAMLSTLNSDYKCLGRATLHDDIVDEMFPVLRRNIEQILKEEMRKGTTFCMGCDLWTCNTTGIS